MSSAPQSIAARGAALLGRPAPRSDGLLALVWRQYRLERRLFWRNPSAAFFSFFLPLLFLAFFGAVAHGNQKEMNVIVPGIAGMSVLSTTFTALAYNIVFLREQGVLKRMRGTPLPPGAYLAGVAANAVTNTFLQIVIIVAVGKAAFGVDGLRDVPELVVFVIAGVIAFASLGVALAHVIPNFDSAPAYVNLVFLPVIFISGVFYDIKDTPAFVADIAKVLPLEHLIAGLNGAMVTGAGFAHHGGDLAVVAVWAAFGVLFAVRGFSWESRRRS